MSAFTILCKRKSLTKTNQIKGNKTGVKKFTNEAKSRAEFCQFGNEVAVELFLANIYHRKKLFFIPDS